jgi:hypothetical protein
MSEAAAAFLIGLEQGVLFAQAQYEQPENPRDAESRRAQLRPPRLAGARVADREIPCAEDNHRGHHFLPHFGLPDQHGLI